MAAHKMQWKFLHELTSPLPPGSYWGQEELEDAIETGVFHWDGERWPGGKPDVLGVVIGLPVMLSGDEDT
jgi:hypothetical protein